MQLTPHTTGSSSSEAPRRLLLIAYHWPPTGGVRVQRWVKLVKYLAQQGWHISVYTPANPIRDYVDEQLLQEIPSTVALLTQPVREPLRLVQRFMRKKDTVGIGLMREKSMRSSWLSKFLLWIRANFFIPDARVGWVRPSFRYLQRYLALHKHDVLVTTGPPHSMHLLGKKLGKACNIPWVADFRDPWVHIDYMHRMPLTQWALAKHKRLERRVVQAANAVVVVTRTMYEEFSAHAPKQIEIISNGYDPVDFPPLATTPEGVKAPLIILHMGPMNPDRNPLILWKTLARLQKEGIATPRTLQLHTLGGADITVKQAVDQWQVQSLVQFLPFIPHEQVPERLQQAGILLLCINDTPVAKGLHTGKLFEYLAAQRPILSLGPHDGEAAVIIHQCEAGVNIALDEEEALYNYLRQALLQGVPTQAVGKEKEVKRYSRKEQAEHYNTLLRSLLS